ncbi:glycoside hydrolase [Lipomyces oligophaga]|uniref:glycoside hydrolase n=1 Tax=Lipomyces oligophaga TaxID=45792 RepID=UPI0034CDE053
MLSVRDIWSSWITVSSIWSSFTGFISSGPASTLVIEQSPDNVNYTGFAIDVFYGIQTWYDQDTGLYENIGWWDSANVITAFADFCLLDMSDAVDLGIPGVLNNTYYNAQGYHDLYLNNAYDDEGWWAMAWIRAYDVTQNPDYLSMAESIFVDMENGTDSVCGGGTWWMKDRQYKNAIANELYLDVAASLANRVSDPAAKQDYYDIAYNQFYWFINSGMINDEGLVNDGLTVNDDGSCTNNGQPTWTYNQGVILGGAVELVRAGANASEIYPPVISIASAAINLLTTDGILYDSCEPSCDSNSILFKGIFMRNLMYLYNAITGVFSPVGDEYSSESETFSSFILYNADTIWNNDRFPENNTFGTEWAGPPANADAATTNAGLETLLAALDVKIHI